MMTIRHVDIAAGWGWAWNWASIGEWQFMLGLNLEISKTLVQFDIGLIVGGFWIEFDW
jgi:hypothetical protein